MTTTTATIVFTDLVGSTALRVALGEERADELRRAHDQLLGAQVSACGGRVVKGGGDGLLAAFDSASAALSAAVAMQRAVAAYNRRPDRLAELSVRIGLSAGDVSWEDGDCFGTPVVEAARLEAAADGGQILCSEFVRMMARGRGGHELEPLGELALKGLPEPVAAYVVGWTEQSGDPRSLSPSLASDASGLLVGREEELAAVLATVAQSGGAAPPVAWLLGEPGIGKTTLAAHAAHDRHRDGWSVYFGRCDDALQSPYQPVAQVVREALRASPGLGRTLPLGTRMGLARLCPDLIDQFDVGLTSSEVGQDQLFEAVSAFLDAATTTVPALVVFDDLHWATDATLLLINYLIRGLSSSRLAMIATVRDTECPELLRSIIDETVARTGALHLRLGGISSDAVIALAGGEAGADIHAQTAGNPFFVRAVLAGGGSATTVDAAVRRRVARLSSACQEILPIAALDGLEFDPRIVAGALGRSVEDVLSATEEATRAALVAEVAAHRFRFSHALVRENLEGQLSATRRVLAHRRLAEAYERTAPWLVNRLALHWAGCAVDEETCRVAVERLSEAGRIASAAFDHDEAIRAFRRARELCEPGDAAGMASVLAALGAALLSSGSRSESTAAIFSEAMELATVAQLPAVWADAQLRLYILLASNGLPPPPSVIPELPAGAEHDPVLRARANAAKAGWLYQNGGGRAVRIEWLQDVYRDAVEVGDSFAIGWMANTLSAALPVRDSARRVEMSQQAIHHWGLLGEDMLATLARGRLLGDHMALGNLSDAEAQLGLIRAAGSLRRDRWLQHYAEASSVPLALVRGNFAEAERAAHCAAEIADDVDGLDVSGLHGVHMFSIRREQGRLGEVAGTLRTLTRLNPDMAGAWRPGLAAAYAELGMVAEARVELGRIVVGPHVDLPDDERWPLSASYLVDAAVVVGDVQIAATLAAHFEPYAELNVAMLNVACYGPAARYLGMAAFAMGDYGRARAYLTDAVGRCQRLGFPTYEVHARYWLARVAAAAGTAEEFGEHLRQGEQIARRLGMAGLAERFARLPLEAV